MLRRVALMLVMMCWVSLAGAEGFTLKDTQGKVHRLEDYKSKWVLVNFWATWCPPCLEEIPDLIKLSETRKDVVVIGIAMEYQDPKYVKEFADNLFVTYPVVLGDRKIAAQIGPIPGLPTSYLYNPQGKLSAQHVGPLTRKGIESYIESKTAAAAPTRSAN